MNGNWVCLYIMTPGITINHLQTGIQHFSVIFTLNTPKIFDINGE